MALDRTWYNSLVNDSGTGLDGTIWDKEDVDALMDAVDAELARIDNYLAGGNFAFVDRTNIFTLPQIVRGMVYVEPHPSDIAARISLYDRDQPGNQRYWQMHAHGQVLRFWALNDDQTTTGVGPTLVLNRSGDAVLTRNMYASGYVEQSRPYFLGFFQPFVAAVQAPIGTPLSYVRSECGFSKVGQCVTARIHIQSINPTTNLPHIRISQVPPAGGASNPTWDQDLCRLHIIGIGPEVGFLMAQNGWWEVYRLNGADFPANQQVFVIAHVTYYV